MRDPKIITGRGFDWAEAQKYADAVVNADGGVNWRAAAFADPGVTQCPQCKAYYWNEGDIVECLDCGAQWETANGKWKRERAAKKEGAR